MAMKRLIPFSFYYYGDGTSKVVTLNPPLPAATAATAWTGNISATNTVHVTVVAALQKAS